MEERKPESPPAQPSLVRPYSLTSGRTSPAVELALEALIQVLPGTDDRARDLDNINATIVALCRESPSVAEIAARVGVPIGVARVLVADLVEAGHVRILATLKDDSSDAERRELIERVLSGLREL
ncbi:MULTISPECIES: DUF742 domain-containing protein [Rhodococcus]|jgi:hypothetical protein|uniref:DUF742 domain-containing protein n=1 Tax=Rhodococcus aetherivorans TaxID=191292 RepID=A0A059MKJ4_9NOCA|nr:MULTISPECIES: DUF742 domain-containing protein [Rhodococcus]ETT26599.1 protein of unknown function DUF742 [Rhodococcus rhodochrous ATCC 21198]NCL77100.1 hypothetical protein [Rhodococcus sp. YH1]OOL29692.1 hypothetical protein GQ85_24405 [Rhodococcus rhodochrous]AKE87889.1 hypothetical protein AAT18_00055 [Rhodococcus aetherivorans]ANZ27473.1 hypothetical protein A4U64_24465 [Rhodococcus sp. WB1]